ncbi:MAG: hypothetical protein KGJ57_12670 [Sphingomonadales bacterium]|nr:hypothetical protein [Sphingomonadales bacterium]MDE2170266.1 hypothetical protein [Sphingomonadales bacterium]
MTHLYIVELGGTRPDSLFEVHIVHALVAEDEHAMIEACREGFAHQLQAAHIDGWVAIALDREDDHSGPGPAGTAGRCWLLEAGRNSLAFLREQHDYRFVQALSGRDAMAILRQEMPGWHVDSVIDVDRLAQERGWRLSRHDPESLPELHQVARYIRFDRISPARQGMMRDADAALPAESRLI